ncbi:tape measure protein [Leucobacter sp. G161]|uniref:tape measure protein n=1 Tax=Leucobacter sp. G161 TaxID=663704 RepID=UPI00073C90D1|nr:tape measure protein [Leucobacter sp. G161]KUF07194.1 hypothetical protein AUL38_02590 [Leucobacter sp. G161]
MIPYLDSVQNAVAAMGGSNQQISEISFIMSQISAASKITGQDLMQFGQRGINAAELIGSQMGKTGAQIREDITAGALDADVALDALAAGMQEKFGGAAANVKNTFSGAMDRVKAAWRDFASELARPLVDPNGGGALVDLLNWAADAMRAFEDLPAPIKGTVSALTGLVGTGALVGGTFMLTYPKVLEFKDALSAVGGIAGIAKGGLARVVSFLTSPWVLGLAAAAASVALFNAAMENSKVSSEQMSSALKQGSSALDEMRSTAKANERGLAKIFVDLESKLENLPALFERTEGAARGFWANNWNDSAALDSIETLGRELASLAAEDLPAAQSAFKRFADEGGLSAKDAIYALNTHMPTLKEQLLDAASAAGIATDDSTLLSIAMGEIDVAAEASKSSLEGIAGAAVDTTEAISKLAEEILNFGSAQISADRAAIDLRAKFDALNKIVNEGAGSLDIYTDAGRKTESAILDVAEAAKKNASAILEATGNEEQANAVLDEARQKLIDQRIALGDNAAAAEDWAARRVPTADQVKAALERVSDAANDIPEDTSANVNTDADKATGKLTATKGAQNAIKPTVGTRVTADTSGAIGPLQAVSGWLARIAAGAHARITTSGGSTGGGSAGGGRSGGFSGGRANGGTIGFAQGGTIPGYAGGDTIGFGGGVRNGTVWGLGTAKSDSINVNLSRGEEVIQEPYASLNRPLLKAINRGDFSPSMMQPQIIVQAPRSPQGQAQVIYNDNSTQINPVAEPRSTEQRRKSQRAAHGVKGLV